ncbi:unnamed protein product [Urochloa humidicola]
MKHKLMRTRLQEASLEWLLPCLRACQCPPHAGQPVTDWGTDKESSKLACEEMEGMSGNDLAQMHYLICSPCQNISAPTGDWLKDNIMLSIVSRMEEHGFVSADYRIRGSALHYAMCHGECQDNLSGDQRQLHNGGD